MRAPAILFVGPSRVEFGEVEIPGPGPGEILVETQYSVVSPGTELRCLGGGQPGSAEWPYIPGYSMMGRVVEAGSGAKIGVGAIVYTAGTKRADVGLQWGGHVGLVNIPDVEAYVVPAGTDCATAAMTHLIAIALRGVRLARPTLYESVAVLGLGPIGQLSARLFAATDARTLAVDVVPERVTAAQNAGIRAILADGDPAAAIRQFLPDGADIVVDATGSEGALRSAIAAARDKPWDDSCAPGARVVIQGSYPGEVPVPYQEAFMKEVSLWLPRSSQPSDIRLALELVSDGRLKAGDIVSRIYRPEEAPRAYAALQSREPNLLTVAFQWTD